MNWEPPDEVHFRRRIPGGLLLLAGVAMAFCVLGIYHDAVWFYFAVPLGFAVLAAWFSMPGNFALRFYPERIEHRPSGLAVKYSDITHLRLSDRSIVDQTSVRQANYFVIGHPRGVFRLPRHDGVDRIALYRWLLDRSALMNPPNSLPGRLDEIRTAELADFGHDQVLSTRGRPLHVHEIPQPKIIWLLALVMLALTITGSILEANEATQATLGGVTFALILLGFLASAAHFSQKRVLRRRRSESGLVISPRCLTMEGADLKGVLRWSEVKSLVPANKKSPALDGLLLNIEGGQIRIGDDYQCPLTEIHRRLAAYLAHERT